MQNRIKYKLVVFISLTVLFLCSCAEDYRENVPEPYNGNIYSFDVGDVQVGSATIINAYEEKRVEIIVEFGTNISAITPTIEISPGATIDPASGTAVDFSQNGEVIYTVTAPSGDTYEWIVSVTVAENPNGINLQLIPNSGNWNQEFTVYSDLTYNTFLTRNSGWNGGDGAVSLGLPNGYTLWSFQDSFFGDVTKNRIRQDNTFVRNAGFLQESDVLNSYIQLNPGSGSETDTWIKYPGANEQNDDFWYWGGPAQVVGDEVQMLVGQITNGGFSGVHLSTDVAIFNLADMSLKEIIQDKYMGELPWDSSIFKANDGFTYMYTSENHGICGSKIYVARAPDNDLRNTWEYLTQDGWTTSRPENNEDYVVALDSNATQANVFEDNGKYYMVSQATCFGLDINIWESDSPAGPFTNRRTLYKIPDRYTQDSAEGPGYITYNAVVHHSLSQEGELVISYNINPIGFENNFNEPGTADNYRPYFVRLYNWR